MQVGLAPAVLQRRQRLLALLHRERLIPPPTLALPLLIIQRIPPRLRGQERLLDVEAQVGTNEVCMSFSS